MKDVVRKTLETSGTPCLLWLPRYDLVKANDPTVSKCMRLDGKSLLSDFPRVDRVTVTHVNQSGVQARSAPNEAETHKNNENRTVTDR